MIRQSEEYLRTRHSGSMSSYLEKNEWFGEIKQALI